MRRVGNSKVKQGSIADWENTPPPQGQGKTARAKTQEGQQGEKSRPSSEVTKREKNRPTKTNSQPTPQKWGPTRRMTARIKKFPDGGEEQVRC